VDQGQDLLGALLITQQVLQVLREVFALEGGAGAEAVVVPLVAGGVGLGEGLRDEPLVLGALGRLP